jgi:hypothetical protein
MEVEISGHYLRGSVTEEQRDAVVAAFLRQVVPSSP